MNKEQPKFREKFLREIAVLVREIAGIPESKWDDAANQELVVARNSLEIALRDGKRS